MKIITIATDLTHPFLVRLLNPSCEAVDLELVVLHPEQSAYQFADKRRMLAEQLLRVAARDELVVVTDAYDALFIRGQRHLEAGYERYDQPVVFSGELNSWPLGPVGMALHPGPPAGRYPYINTGGLIGPAGDIHDLCVKYAKAPTDQFELLVHLQAHGYRYHEQFSWSDQYHWTLVSLLEREMVGIDHDAAMFECFGPVIPDVVYSEVMRDVHDFAERGVGSDAYQRERDELLARLEVPSGAAHLHFAGSITKAATLEFLDTEQLPEWLSVAYAAGPTPVRPGQIVRI